MEMGGEGKGERKGKVELKVKIKSREKRRRKSKGKRYTQVNTGSGRHAYTQVERRRFKINEANKTGPFQYTQALRYTHTQVTEVKTATQGTREMPNVLKPRLSVPGPKTHKGANWHSTSEEIRPCMKNGDGM